MSFSSTVFPVPLGPRIVNTSPGLTARETSRCIDEAPNRTPTLTSSTRGGEAFTGHPIIRRSFVMKKSATKITMHPVTTAEVVALPTPSVPPLAFSPL